jgi:hypothetical protein
MAFMLIILAFLLVVTVWAFFHTNPHGVPARRLLAFNAVVLALAVPVAVAVGVWLYGEAVAVKANEKGMAAYLTIMASGTAALLVVAIGGFVRNFFVFPHGKRAGPPPSQTTP